MWVGWDGALTCMSLQQTVSVNTRLIGRPSGGLPSGPVNMKLPAHLVLGAAAAALLALPAGHEPAQPPPPATLTHTAPPGYATRTADLKWISAVDPDGHGEHGRHEEPPHVDPPDYDPTPLETVSYSVTGTAGPSYAFRLRLSSEK